MAKRFKTKDLTINVGGVEDIANIDPQFCFQFSPCPPLSQCRFVSPHCPGASIFCHVWTPHCRWHTTIGCGAFTPPWTGCTFDTTIVFDQQQQVVLPPEQLAAMKQELQSAMAAIEAREAEAVAADQPQSVEEAEELEAKLKDALDEVGKIKKKLAKG